MNIKNFIEDWVYPAYSLKNSLFKRYDLIKTCLDATKYADIRERMFHANMQLIVEFIEKEKAKELVDWSNPTYGNDKCLFPQYKGIKIITLIDSIYEFYKETLPLMESDYKYACKIWGDYLCSNEKEFNKFKNAMDKEALKTYMLEKPADFSDDKIDWKRFEKIIKKEDFWKPNALNDALDDLENKIEENKQHFTILAVELRQYLWT